ncbi:hypothetical protein HZH68_015083 [Vespula germanica]|uniref:Uncharacterized protein n=1 Tax=Vespula germanica TaxID=30212 RepID=A0A834JA58_VESGE|nr:hypothetical protein HZH68_015083 [Vespula germanica]
MKKERKKKNGWIVPASEGWGDGKEDRRVGRSSKRAIVEFENGINKELKMEMVEEVGGEEEGEEEEEEGGEGERGGGGGEVCV